MAIKKTATASGVIKVVPAGEYTAKVVSVKDGKTPSQTLITMLVENKEFKGLGTIWVDWEKVLFQDSTGADVTSEDIFFNGIARQWKVDATHEELLTRAFADTFQVWVSHYTDEDGNIFANFRTTKPRTVEADDAVDALE